jgi:hypothetical protein
MKYNYIKIVYINIMFKDMPWTVKPWKFHNFQNSYSKYRNLFIFKKATFSEDKFLKVREYAT